MLEQELNGCLRGAATIDLDAIKFNMDSMKNHISPNSKIMTVIKTNAYGHGANQISRVLENLDYVFGYAVATVEEAAALRRDGRKKPILVLGYTFPYSYEYMCEEEIRPAVFREDSLEALSQAAQKIGKSLKVHIKVDTGMGRIGVKPNADGLAFVKKLYATPGIEVEGIFTHFAKADEVDKTYAELQYKRFYEFIETIQSTLDVNIPIKHCSNSAGIMELPKVHMDMVRAGITLYGLMPSDEVDKNCLPLKPVMSLESHISYIKELDVGESVSYGGLFVAKKKTRVATVPLGYGDGFPRLLTGKGEVIIQGKRVPIIGRICMDQFMVDISELPDVKMGELVTLLGKNGEEQITAEELGAKSGRFNYELACMISARVPRKYIYESKVIAIEGPSIYA